MRIVNHEGTEGTKDESGGGESVVGGDYWGGL
jgi:hypothetical protein